MLPEPRYYWAQVNDDPPNWVTIEKDGARFTYDANARYELRELPPPEPLPKLPPLERVEIRIHRLGGSTALGDSE